MSKKYVSSLGPAICLVASLFAIDNSTANAATDCLASPDRQSGASARWHYRIDPTTHQRCWYLKRAGSSARARPSRLARARSLNETRDTPSGVARRASAARANPSEASTDTESSIKAWFTSTFGALSGSSSTEPNAAAEPSASQSSPARKQRTNAATERSEQTKASRAQQRSSPSAAASAAEPTPATQTINSEQEKALYQEFLEWRAQQILLE